MLVAQTKRPVSSPFSRTKLDWVVPGQIAAMALPSTRDVTRLRRMGVTMLVSVISTPLPPEELRSAGLKYLHLPVMYLRAPTVEQMETFNQAAKAEIEAGGKVAVHCVGGIGRTGTIIAAYLVEQGLSAREAISQVRARRAGSVESLEQENAVFAWAKQKSARAAIEAIPTEIVEEVAVEEAYDASEREMSDAWPGEERIPAMTRVAKAGYLKWHSDGTGVDVRALSSGDGECPKIENLKVALRELNIDNGTTVTLTETLGKGGEAWVSVSCDAGEQGALLITAGLIVNMLVSANVYEEVLLSSE